MNPFLKQIMAAVIVLLGAVGAMATEEAKYTLVEKSGAFEIRDYERHLLVETIVDSSLEDAGNLAFRKLFRYISGNNVSNNSIAMTAPVAQEARGGKIAMTAPVGQQAAQGGWAVSFMMPANYTLQTLPLPTDPTLSVREVPARRMAVIRYSGTWSQERYLENKEQLDSWILKKGFTATGEPVWARYNPPFTLWFLRRNEVLIPIAMK
ncbi:MAG: heme-binding protein [bacterium]